MIQQSCFESFCFIPPDSVSNITKIFGFSEFLASLALLVVVFTVSDFRYKFRISIAPIPLYRITFIIISLTGFGSLLSDVWLAQKWWVLKTNYEIRVIFQSLLGFLFLGCFILWIYYAFIKPPKFGKTNHSRYLNTLYSTILKGNNSELAVIADELGNSSDRIIEHGEIGRTKKISKSANQIMLLLANKKFCKVIASESPLTAYLIFKSISNKNKYDLPINQFSSSISEEALLNKDSVIYHENDDFQSGLMGYTKEWSKAIYGNSLLIDNLNRRHLSPFEISYKVFNVFDSQQWEAYGRLICLYLEDLCSTSSHLISSTTLSRTFKNYEYCTNNLFKINNETNENLKEDLIQKASVATNFVNSIFKVIDNKKINTSFMRSQGESRKFPYPKDISDDLAELMFEIIFSAAQIKTKDYTLWYVQYSIVWDKFFGLFHFHDTNKTSDFYRKTKGKLIRLLFDEIKSIDEMPNFKNVRIAGYLLNIFGLKEGVTHSTRKYKDLILLKETTINIIKIKYLTLVEEMPDVAEHMLVGGLSYDLENRKLIKTYTKSLRKTADRDVLDLE